MICYKFSPIKIFFGMTQFTPTTFDSKKVYICDTGVLGGLPGIRSI